MHLSRLANFPWRLEVRGAHKCASMLTRRPQTLWVQLTATESPRRFAKVCNKGERGSCDGQGEFTDEVNAQRRVAPDIRTIWNFRGNIRKVQAHFANPNVLWRQCRT